MSAPPLHPPQRTPENARRKAYKGQADVNSGRRRRENQLIQLRKSRREDTLSKRRRDDASTPSTEPEPELSDPPSPSDPSPPACTTDADSNNLLGIINGLESENISLQLEATVSIRKILSADGNSLAEEVIRVGVVARLVELLFSNKNPQLQLEAAWALTNITAGTSEHTEVVTNAGAVPKLVKLLESPHSNVREQAMWALGNIAADSQRCRELVIDHGGLVQLLSQFNEHAKVSNIRMATWTLSNLCFGKLPSKSQTKAVLQILQQLLNSIDEKILSDTCWAISYLCSHSTDEIQMVIESRICPQLVKLLMHSSPKVVTPVMLAIANVSSADDSQVQCLIDIGLLQCLPKLLVRNYQKYIKKQACMTVSNICAGTVAQIQAIIDAKMVPLLIQLSQHGETDIKKESTWAIANATSGGSPEQNLSLVGDGCIPTLCNGLKFCDPDLLYACLNGLESVLKVGEMEKTKDGAGMNTYAVLIEECGGLDKLENLQDFDNDAIYEKTIKLLESYWLEEGGESEAPKEPSPDDS
ncbi:importin subunit alpha-1a-like protein [Carex littledalei]|uniref:Importin subunit alpha n=1 Tax=Carex littledalei TaxID=544730 RepID=A0A833VEE1_9POAL|nr:importin subunit alpha-1a-like protein [Carex littledalei]